MKSPYQIAKELKVSPQAVYQKIDRMQEQLNKHIQRSGKRMLVDEHGESLIKSSFPGAVEQAVEQVEQVPIEQAEQPQVEQIEQPIQPLVQVLEGELNKQLNTENAFLRERVKALESELKVERTHSRAQTDKMSDLAAQLAELSRNNQILLGAEQSRTNPALLTNDSEPAQGEKTPVKRKWPWGLFQKQ